MHVEVELKYAINQADIAHLLALPLIQQVQQYARTRFLKSIYYDLPNSAILQNGYVLRVRAIDGGYIQTIKTTNQSQNGLHQRKEWNSSVFSFQPDLNAIADPILFSLFKEICGDNPLLPVCETAFERISWDIVSTDDTVVELSLDQGTVCAQGLCEPICEIELELKHGEQKGLFDLSEQLMQVLPLIPENRAKAERGFRLAVTE